jgi:hypothetical protein
MFIRWFKKNYQKLILLSWQGCVAYADLPKPPLSDMANSSNDWIDVGGQLAYKTLSYALIAMGVMIVSGAAFGIFKSYHVAQERQDLGHFFKHTAVAIAAVAIGAGLLFVGHSIIPS